MLAGILNNSGFVKKVHLFLNDKVPQYLPRLMLDRTYFLQINAQYKTS